MSIDPLTPAVHITDDGAIRITLTGEMDELITGTLARLWTEILTPNQRIELDLSAVTFFNSSAVAALVEGYHQAQTMGTTITVTHASRIVARVMQITGIDHFLEPVLKVCADQWADRAVWGRRSY